MLNNVTFSSTTGVILFAVSFLVWVVLVLVYAWRQRNVTESN